MIKDKVKHYDCLFRVSPGTDGKSTFRKPILASKSIWISTATCLTPLI
ncbi:MAG: hypothetical protein LBG28_12250 [Tannerella sp.]|nr:hypothetical protein [Tannerella sp.]